MKRRGSGILLHITSLPSPYGIGDFGPGAYQFADFLVEAGQGFWQILPLNPTSAAHAHSPYSSYCTFAGNHLLISPDLLAEKGLLSPADIEDHPAFSDEAVSYEAVIKYKERLLRTAFENCRRKLKTDAAFVQFCSDNQDWVDDYALFVALKERFGGAAWNEWPEDIRNRRKDALQKWRKDLADEILREKFFQHIFFEQWSSLKTYCNERSIQIIGDMPIYVNYDSSHVWSHPEVFKLDKERRPVFVAGVPPDYFSATGQLWGNPVYDWNVLKKTGYAWWIRRMAQNLKLFDMVRLDHFRGFVAYWEVGAGEETAINGKWVEAPVEDFFDTLYRRFPYLPVIAEDLGYITADVREAIHRYDLPTMKVLLFAFGHGVAANPYAPHNHVKNCIVYTGTHDNNTVRGWFTKETSPEDRKRLFAYLGREISEDQIHWEFIRTAMMSVADVAIMPVQDILGLGEEARMNRPSTMDGNWAWRLKADQLTPAVGKKLAGMARIYARG